MFDGFTFQLIPIYQSKQINKGRIGTAKRVERQKQRAERNGNEEKGKTRKEPGGTAEKGDTEAGEEGRVEKQPKR